VADDKPDMTDIPRPHEAVTRLLHATAQIWQFGIPWSRVDAHPATRTKSAI
jgi:hypothetical protein